MAHGTVNLLIAYDSSPSAATAVRAAASLFRDARASVATVPAEPTLRAGTAVPMLPGVSPAAARQVGAARSVLLGSVSSGLVQNAELPVLVVPGESTHENG